MPAFVDLTGQRFNRLTVTKRSEERSLKVKWLCKCDCGNELSVIAAHLKNGNTKSCGCQRVDSARINGLKIKHGMTGCPEYKAWQGIRDRCYNERNENYKNYGARGIVVCSEWLMSFETFYKDMGPRPGRGYSIDRIEVNGNYEPGNCRWATSEEQSNNKRLNVYFEVGGEKMTIPQLSRKYGIPLTTLASRIYRDKLPIDEALKKKASHRIAHLNGVSKRLHEWAAELKIPYPKIYRFVNTVSPNLEELVGGLENRSHS